MVNSAALRLEKLEGIWLTCYASKWFDLVPQYMFFKFIIVFFFQSLVLSCVEHKILRLIY